MTNFSISTEQVQWGKDNVNSVDIRGLSYQDFTTLFSDNGKVVDEIFTFIEQSNAPGGPKFDAKEFGVGLIAKAPLVVAQMIALAADIPDRAKDVARMPLPVQTKCMEAIYRMTVEEAGGFSDFLALITRMAKAVRQKVRLMNLSLDPEMMKELDPNDNIGS